MPHVDYTRWGLTVAPLNTATGEDVRWLPRSLTTEVELPPDDFWLFDDERVVFTDFEEGGPLRWWAETTDRRITDRCREVRGQVWALAVSHDTHVAS